MRNLGVWIEIGGLQTYVGRIIGEKEEDVRFSYAEEYLSGNIARPISIHLPLSENAFSVDDTRNFFEGLLPEGFTRRCVAGLLHTDANNYLSLLAGLGNECLGAIKIAITSQTQKMKMAAKPPHNSPAVKLRISCHRAAQPEKVMPL